MGDFDSWNELKKHLHQKDAIIGIKERNIAFVHMGKNIGSEENGKDEEYLRPVVVLKVFNRHSFLGVAMTSQTKEGRFYFPFVFTHKGREYQSTAILSQIKYYDTKRVKYTKGMIKKEDFEVLKEKIADVTLSKEREPRREFVNQVYHKNSNKANFFIHESSYIDENVTIGEGTKIWHFCHVLSQTNIGKNCSFGQNCVIGPKVNIGNNVKVQNNVSIYEGVEIEDDVFLGPSMVFTNVINPRAFIQRKDEFKKTILKKGCSIGANATIVCGVTIGRYALIGAGAVVTKDVPDFALMVGVPARQIGWVDKAGNRMEFDEEGIAVDSYDGSRYCIIDGRVKEM